MYQSSQSVILDYMKEVFKDYLKAKDESTEYSPYNNNNRKDILNDFFEYVDSGQSSANITVLSHVDRDDMKAEYPNLNENQLDDVIYELAEHWPFGEELENAIETTIDDLGYGGNSDSSSSSGSPYTLTSMLGAVEKPKNGYSDYAGDNIDAKER